MESWRCKKSYYTFKIILLTLHVQDRNVVLGLDDRIPVESLLQISIAPVVMEI